MIRRSIPIALAAILVSLLLHVLGIGWQALTREAAIEPAPEAAPAVPDVGGAFEELVEPLPEPPEPEQAEAVEPPEVTPPDQLPTTQALVASDNPEDVIAPDAAAQQTSEPASSAGEEADATQQESGEDDINSDVAVLSPVTPDTEPQPPEGVEDGTPEPSEEAVETEDAPAPEEITPETEQAALAPVPEATDNVITAQEPDLESAAVSRSLRPPKERPSAEALGVPERRQAQASRTPTYESPLTAYKRNGTDLLALGRIGNASPGDFGGSGGAGNAGTTNYVGKVLMKLNRGPRVNDQATGMARVYFQINPDGSLAWIRILNSSGSADIRTAAQAQVRSAAPFPRPPGGRAEKMVFVYRNR